ncbi:hypothetical protein Tco_1067990 [Tanacetum coccineum]|uniref:MAK10-like protein n=1 Tax=Tanacetum coccineum TaxID=301880 RepID=A0ABQ5HGK2_9ASTR
MGNENHIHTLGDYSKPSHEGYRNTIELLAGNNVVPLRSDTIRLVLNECSFHGLRSEDPNQHLKDFLKLLATGLNAFQQDPSPHGRILLPDSLLNSFHQEGPQNSATNDPRDFAKSVALPQDVPSTSDRHLIELENQVQRLMEAHLALTRPTRVNKITTKCEICNGPHDTQYCMENPEQAFVKYASSHTNEVGEDDGEVMFIKIIRDDDEPRDEGPNEGEGATTEEPVVEYSDTFPTRDELTYHRMYNWIMRRKLDPKGDTNRGISNFTRRIKGMHVFVGNFTYVIDFMIVEDISSIIDPRLSQVVLGRPFVEISNMTHDPPKGVIRFIRGADEVAYKIPHKIEQYNSLSDLEKEHTKSVYLRNEEDKRRGVEYVMSKILGFYKECLELGPEYLIGVDDDGEVT